MPGCSLGNKLERQPSLRGAGSPGRLEARSEDLKELKLVGFLKMFRDLRVP